MAMGKKWSVVSLRGFWSQRSCWSVRPIETVDTHPLLTTMAIYHSLVCYSNLVPSGHRPHSRLRRLFRKLRSCHASLRASFSQKRCQCVWVLILQRSSVREW